MRKGGNPMWRNRIFMGAVLLLPLVVPGMASAALTTSYTGSVSFSSDLEADKTITLPSFDTLGGTRTLTDVLVEFFFSGSCDIGVDSDDGDEEFDVNARIIRTWSGTGPDIFPASGTKTYTPVPVVHLGMDNGDGGTLDLSAPDGTNFGGVAFAMEAGTSHNPTESYYDTNGPGTVDFTIDVKTIVNDFQSSPDTPDEYQLDLQNSLLTVYTKVTYTYTPEPATMAMLGLGALGLAARRRRSR